MDKANPDSFGTFLRHLQTGAKGAPSDAVAHLARILAERGSAPTDDLMADSGLSAGSFVRALVRLHEAGYVESAGEGDDEVLSITVAGAEFAARASA